MTPNTGCFYFLNDAVYIKLQKRYGDNTPPWRTPANSRKKWELYPFHFTHVTDMLNHNSNIRKISFGSFLSINLLNRAELFIRSNALLVNRNNVWHRFKQKVVNDAVDEWQKRLYG